MAASYFFLLDFFSSIPTVVALDVTDVGSSRGKILLKKKKVIIKTKP